MFETSQRSYDLSRNFGESAYLVNSNNNNGPYDYRADTLRCLVPWTLISAIIVLIGIAFIFIAYFVPSQAVNQIAWLIPSIILISLSGTLLVFVLPMSFCCIRNTADLYENWLAQGHMIYWRKEDFTDDIWNRFLEEEYGDRGRSRTKFDRKWFIIRFIIWIFFCGFFCGMVALRLYFNGELLIRGMSFGTEVAILGFSIGTLSLLFMIVAAEVRFYLARSTAFRGPFEFIADDNAFLWMNSYFYIGVGHCCIVSHGLLEDRRVNLYHGTKHPCIEICTSRQTRNGKNYYFHRIPIPINKMDEAQNFAQPGPGRAVCWKRLEGYAAELERHAV